MSPRPIKREVFSPNNPSAPTLDKLQVEKLRNAFTSMCTSGVELSMTENPSSSIIMKHALFKCYVSQHATHFCNAKTQRRLPSTRRTRRCGDTRLLAIPSLSDREVRSRHELRRDLHRRVSQVARADFLGRDENEQRLRTDPRGGKASATGVDGDRLPLWTAKGFRNRLDRGSIVAVMTLRISTGTSCRVQDA